MALLVMGNKLNLLPITNSQAEGSPLPFLMCSMTWAVQNIWGRALFGEGLFESTLLPNISLRLACSVP